jgi:CubicO group peptidase (beta-lactamase class C family)
MHENHRSLQWVTVAMACAVASGCGGPDPIEEQLDAIAEHAREEGELNGNVLITRGAKVLYERSFGTADLASGRANAADTRFAIASISKPFTAVLVMQLMEAGELTPETRLEKIFPELAGKPAGELSVHQLLTHTSGIPEIISRDPRKRITSQDLASLTPKTGADFEYSNTGYVCLALVVEALTGGSYEAAVQRGILTPAGMGDSGVLRTGKTVPGLARGHRGTLGLEPVNLDFAPEIVDGAGSIYSTARDLWRFDRALAEGRLVSARTQQLMYTQHVRDRHGYGWFLSEQGGQYYPWHSGDMNGYSASFARQVRRDEAIVILGNSAGTQARALQKEFLQALKHVP